MKDVILVISHQVTSKNSKVNWPDLNYPGSGQTILRTVYHIDYDKLWVQLDDAAGPIFHAEDCPQGVGFYQFLDSNSTKEGSGWRKRQIQNLVKENSKVDNVVELKTK